MSLPKVLFFPAVNEIAGEWYKCVLLEQDFEQTKSQTLCVCTLLSKDTGQSFV